VTLSYDSVTVGYDAPVLSDVSFDVGDGDVVCLLGPNGVGKTTLLEAAVGLRAPLSGTVSVDGTPVSEIPRRDLAKRVGYVPQRDEQSAPATVFETVLMGRKPYMGLRPSDEDREIAGSVLDELDLAEFAMRDVGALSGGERQKVSVARALAQKPETLVLDEPTSDLDIRYEMDVLQTVREWADDGRGVVCAMHDLTVAVRFADQFVLLAEGGVHAAGGPEVVTPENVEAVYGVPVDVLETEDGPAVVPKHGR